MRRPLLLLALLGALSAVGFFPATASATAPTNDNFAAAQALFGQSGEVVATNKEATKELGEPAHAGNAGGASVWFHWTADRNGTLTVWTYRPSFDTVLAVYTGASVDALTEIVSNDDTGVSVSSRVTVPIVSGTDYRIAVDGVGGATGPFRLRWREGPENDNFADAEGISGSSGSVHGVPYGATVESSELIEFSTASVWYRWTAPEDGVFSFFVENARGLSISTGSSIDSLTPVAGPDFAASFAATAGTEYSVRVAGWSWNDAFGFTLHWGHAPVNDAFADATALGGGQGSLDGSNAFSSVETSESSFDAIRASVWYTWTAPKSGWVRFDAWTKKEAPWGRMDTILSVHTGSTVDSLTLVSRNDDWTWPGLPARGSAVSFHAVAGTIYTISVASYYYNWGTFGLRWYPGRIVFGKSGDSDISGTEGRDFLSGGGGDDVIRGLDGGDILFGGSGRDRLYGGDGPDLLISRDFRRGNDVIYGGEGLDTARRDRGDEMHEVP